MPRFKDILIAVLIVALMWVWKANASGPIGPETGPDSTNSYSMPDGCYSTPKNASPSDSDLTTANIKKDVDILAVMESYKEAPTCSGTLNGTRWCDNEDGTVTDLTTGLVWLQKAKWGGKRKIYESSATSVENAHDRTSFLKTGATGANLNDGSVEEDWRLPTLSELKELTSGDEAISSSSMGPFTGVQSSYYWSSSIDSNGQGIGWHVNLGVGIVDIADRAIVLDVWPVRDGN